MRNRLARINHPPIVVMMITSLLLAFSVPGVHVTGWAPAWVSSGLYLLAGIMCFLILLFPDNECIRALSGMVVGGAFAWRGVNSIAANLFYNAGRPLYAVFLYVGFALYIMLSWHRVLPQKASVGRRVQGLQNRDV